ncbi:MAG: hypothetical protein HQL35_05355 [Alphaproteobacteria bacterium]|nr:hypothetical protein [Alphaproteobacteria bacterium]
MAAASAPSPLSPRIRLMLSLALIGFMAAAGGVYLWPLDLSFETTVPADSERYILPHDLNVNEQFVLQGLKFGMTPRLVREAHPAARITTGDNGSGMARVDGPRGRMIAWMKGETGHVYVAGKTHRRTLPRIYRMRLDETFARLGEKELLDAYAREYGRPIDVSCARVQMGDTPRCTYRWWGGGGIEVEASVKRKTDASGREYTQLTTTATNTRHISGAITWRKSPVRLRRDGEG